MPEPTGIPARVDTLGLTWRIAFFVAFGLAAYLLHWHQALLFLALLVAQIIVNLAVIRRWNPGLLRERVKKGPEGEPFDKAMRAVLTLLLFAMFAVAGLDVLKFHWSPDPPPPVWLGVALYIASEIPIAWSMACNPFLERVVRIQSDRAHTPITTGPYRYVRHPMYAGGILMLAAIPMIFESWWTFLPAGLAIAAFIVRTALEDRTLQAKLPGYADYARRTRYLLLPGVW